MFSSSVSLADCTKSFTALGMGGTACSCGVRLGIVIVFGGRPRFAGTTNSGCQSIGAGHNTSSIPAGAVAPSSRAGLRPLAGAFSLSLTVRRCLTALPTADTLLACWAEGSLARVAIEDDIAYTMKLVLVINTRETDAGEFSPIFGRSVDQNCHVTML